ncbi:MAG TPA: hypothetical protein EYP24_03945 [bacterium (Candidatus Stahlbacteria)]|nr:hypothetical protein [Candidatus Stahlbacteria bacterium]
MKIERSDLALLRTLELGIDPTRKIPDRVLKLKEAGIIESFGLRLFLPLLLGGRWFFIIFRISGANSEIVNTFDFPIEIGINRSIPDGKLPDLTISLFTQDPEKEEAILRERRPGYFEKKILNEYDFPIALPLSSEETEILKVMFDDPLTPINSIATRLSLSPSVVRSKLSKLLLDVNQKGIISIVPSINWTKIKSMLHLHIGIETGLNDNMLKERLVDVGLDSAGWYRGTIHQLEFDLWEPKELITVIDKIVKIKDIKLVGLLIALRSVVIDHWIRPLIEKI